MDGFRFRFHESSLVRSCAVAKLILLMLFSCLILWRRKLSRAVLSTAWYSCTFCLITLGGWVYTIYFPPYYYSSSNEHLNSCFGGCSSHVWLWSSLLLQRKILRCSTMAIDLVCDWEWGFGVWMPIPCFSIIWWISTAIVF